MSREKRIKKIKEKWKKGDCILKYNTRDGMIVGGKLIEVINKVNEIIDYLNKR